MKSPNRETSRFHLLDKPKGCVCVHMHTCMCIYARFLSIMLGLRTVVLSLSFLQCLSFLEFSCMVTYNSITAVLNLLLILSYKYNPKLEFWSSEAHTCAFYPMCPSLASMNAETHPQWAGKRELCW